MAKSSKKSGGTKMLGPFYTPDGKSNLGGSPVGGPTGGKAVPDPLNLNKAGRGK